VASLPNLVAIHIPGSVLLLRDPNWIIKIERLVGPILAVALYTDNDLDNLHHDLHRNDDVDFDSDVDNEDDDDDTVMMMMMMMLMMIMMMMMLMMTTTIMMMMMMIMMMTKMSTPIRRVMMIMIITILIIMLLL